MASKKIRNCDLMSRGMMDQGALEPTVQSQHSAIASYMHSEADRFEVLARGESLAASQRLFGKAEAYREIAEKAEREGWVRTR